MINMTLPRPPEPIDATLLPELVDLYMQYDRTRRVQPSTVANNRYALRLFLRWLDAQPHKLLDAAALSHYLVWLDGDYHTAAGRRLRPSNLAYYCARLRRFFSWCHSQGCTSGIDLAALLPVVDKIKPSTYFPTLNNLQKMFDAALLREMPRLRLRDTALLATLLATGARRSEIASAQRIDTHWDEAGGYLHLRKVKGNMSGDGPGRQVVFDGSTARLLRMWIDASNGATLFETHQTNVYEIVRTHAIAAGVPRISPHALRRAFADYWEIIDRLAQHYGITRSEVLLIAVDRMYERERESMVTISPDAAQSHQATN